MRTEVSGLSGRKEAGWEDVKRYRQGQVTNFGSVTAILIQKSDLVNDPTGDINPFVLLMLSICKESSVGYVAAKSTTPFYFTIAYDSGSTAVVYIMSSYSILCPKPND